MPTYEFDLSVSNAPQNTHKVEVFLHYSSQSAPESTFTFYSPSTESFNLSIVSQYNLDPADEFYAVILCKDSSGVTLSLKSIGSYVVGDEGVEAGGGGP